MGLEAKKHMVSVAQCLGDESGPLWLSESDPKGELIAGNWDGKMKVLWKPKNGSGLGVFPMNYGDMVEYPIYI